MRFVAECSVGRYSIAVCVVLCNGSTQIMRQLNGHLIVTTSQEIFDSETAMLRVMPDALTMRDADWSAGFVVDLRLC